jgi:hypothetical protein
VKIGMSAEEKAKLLSECAKHTYINGNKLAIALKSILTRFKNK